VNHTAEDYYRACAAEMMAKAQSAPSKAIRQTYLNLALNWSYRASSGEDAATEAEGAGTLGRPVSEKI
jgi:hypothetical protein